MLEQTLDTSLKPEADKLNASIAVLIEEAEQKVASLAKELQIATDNVNKQDKTDARENADLQTAREYQGRINFQYISAQKRLAALRSGYTEYKPNGIVTLGTTVELVIVSVDDNAPKFPKTRFTLKLVEHDASDVYNGFLATDSVVGLAIIGKVAGDTVLVRAPLGSISYKIERIY